jgi:hypothetical protein
MDRTAPERHGCRSGPAVDLHGIAEQLDVVGSNGIARREVREPLGHPDLVALKNPGIALDRLHQRAGFTLFGGRAFAEAAAGQAGPELVDVLGWPRKIVCGVKIGVHRQVGFDSLEPRDHAGKRAHMLLEARHRGSRRYGAVSSAGHYQLGAGAKLDRRRLAPRVQQFPVSAGRALRAGRNVMLGDGRAQKVEADDVIVQLGAKPGGDRLGDFDGGKLDAALPQGVAGQRRNRDGARRSA